MYCSAHFGLQSLLILTHNKSFFTSPTSIANAMINLLILSLSLTLTQHNAYSHSLDSSSSRTPTWLATCGTCACGTDTRSARRTRHASSTTWRTRTWARCSSDAAQKIKEYQRASGPEGEAKAKAKAVEGKATESKAAGA